MKTTWNLAWAHLRPLWWKVIKIFCFWLTVWSRRRSHFELFAMTVEMLLTSMYIVWPEWNLAWLIRVPARTQWHVNIMSHIVRHLLVPGNDMLYNFMLDLLEISQGEEEFHFEDSHLPIRNHVHCAPWWQPQVNYVWQSLWFPGHCHVCRTLFEEKIRQKYSVLSGATAALPDERRGARARSTLLAALIIIIIIILLNELPFWRL